MARLHKKPITFMSRDGWCLSMGISSTSLWDLAGYTHGRYWVLQASFLTQRNPGMAHDLYDPISEVMQVNKMIPCLKGSKTEPSSSMEALENPEEERGRLWLLSCFSEINDAISWRYLPSMEAAYSLWGIFWNYFLKQIPCWACLSTPLIPSLRS